LLNETGGGRFVKEVRGNATDYPPPGHRFAAAGIRCPAVHIASTPCRLAQHPHNHVQQSGNKRGLMGHLWYPEWPLKALQSLSESLHHYHRSHHNRGHHICACARLCRVVKYRFVRNGVRYVKLILRTFDADSYEGWSCAFAITH